MRSKYVNGDIEPHILVQILWFGMYAFYYKSKAFISKVLKDNI